MSKRILAVVMDNVKLPELNNIWGPIVTPTLFSITSIRSMLAQNRTIYACDPRCPKDTKKYIKLSLANYNKTLFHHNDYNIYKKFQETKVTSSNQTESKIKEIVPMMDNSKETLFSEIPEIKPIDCEESIISGEIEFETTLLDVEETSVEIACSPSTDDGFKQISTDNMNYSERKKKSKGKHHH